MRFLICGTIITGPSRANRVVLHAPRLPVLKDNTKLDRRGLEEPGRTGDALGKILASSLGIAQSGNIVVPARGRESLRSEVGGVWVCRGSCKKTSEVI